MTADDRVAAALARAKDEVRWGPLLPSPNRLIFEDRALLAEVLDRVTDLFEQWAVEENEHRRAGQYGLAEGLRVASDMLRNAIEGKS